MGVEGGDEIASFAKFNGCGETEHSAADDENMLSLHYVISEIIVMLRNGHILFREWEIAQCAHI